jgi:hypothetical protein
MGASRSRRRTLVNGRNAVGPSFVMLPHYVMDSAAFRSLKSGPRALLLEIIRRHNGVNNGQIGLGAREAAKALSLADKDTANGYFHMLEDCGLIRAVSRGGFNMKDPASRRASEWALTWEKVGDQSATKDFIAWGRAQAAEAEKTTVRKKQRIGPEKPAMGGGGDAIGPENLDLAA